MVDMNVVKNRLMRGAAVGAGSFASSFAATLIEEKLGAGDLGSAAGQVVTGLGVSVGVDEVFTNKTSLPNEAIEHFGYGVQGAGFSNIAESVTSSAQTGRVVTVSANASEQQEAQNNQTQQNAGGSAGQEFSLDTA